MSSAVRQFPRATIALLALLAAACGGSGGSGSVLGDAVGRIGQIRAGDLSVRFTMAPKTRPSSNTVGLEMQGSFALDQRLPLPVLNVAYTRLAGTRSRSIRIESNGRSATIVSASTSIPLTGQQQQTLASTLQGPQGLGNLPLHIGQWVANPSERSGPTLAGHPTEQVSGHVNASQALSDLNAISQGGVHRAAGSGSSSAPKVVRSSTFLADVGRDDHLLRRLYVRVTLAPPAGPATQGLTITLDLAITPRPLKR